VEGKEGERRLKIYELAVQATNEFQTHQFEDSIRTLNELLQLKPTSLVVQHNIAVAKYYLENKKDLGKFYDELKNLEEKHEEIIKGNRKGKEKEKEKEEENINIISYNIAIICLQDGRYKEAIEVLENLFVRSHNVDEYLTFKISLILLDLYLHQKLVTKASEMISYIEKTYNSNFLAQFKVTESHSNKR